MFRNFLSCDWGTSHLRVRLVETSTLQVLAEIKTDDGAAMISQAGPERECAARFSQTLLACVRQLFELAGTEAEVCVVAGMASSSIGWMALPYAPTPLNLSADSLVSHALSVSDLSVVLISGVCTGNDVMRGEECELLGLIGLQPDLAAARTCLILPGTHSKHIQLDDGVLSSFTTHMTGELYTHLRQTPTLRAATSVEGPTSEREFLAGVASAGRDGLLAALFKIRSRPLTSEHGDLHGPSFLSGVLIGSELRHLPDDRPVFLASTPPLCDLYALAAAALQKPLRIIPPATLPLALLHAHRDLLPSKT